MQFGGMGVYFGLIHDKDWGASVRGMLLANQLTWGLTSILGLNALFSDSFQALDIFSFAVSLGMFGQLTLNWLGTVYGQYVRVTTGIYSFGDTLNLYWLAATVSYNIVSFVLYQYLMSNLCELSYFEY